MPHLTTLDLQVARGERTAPDRAAPDLKVIQELGLRHETVYSRIWLRRDSRSRIWDMSSIAKKHG